MARGTVLVDPNHATLEDAEKPFNRVGMGASAHIFARSMLDREMVFELLADGAVDGGLVGHQHRVGLDLRLEDRPQRRGVHVIDVLGTNPAAALDQGHDRVLVGIAASVACLRTLLPNVGFVRLNSFPGATHRLHAENHHRLAEPVRHEPRGFQRHAERPVKLLAADPLLAGTQQIGSLKPDMQRDVARLKHGPDADGELLPAGVALLETEPDPVELVLDASECRGPADGPAMWADDITPPDNRL